jgi:hypothetical protein
MQILTDKKLDDIIQENVVRAIKKLNAQKSDDTYTEERDALLHLNPLVVNFGNPNVSILSVERVQHGTISEHTVVCYMLVDKDGLVSKENGNTARDWHLWISRKQHQELCFNFANFIE